MKYKTQPARLLCRQIKLVCIWVHHGLGETRIAVAQAIKPLAKIGLSNAYMSSIGCIKASHVMIQPYPPLFFSQPLVLVHALILVFGLLLKPPPDLLEIPQPLMESPSYPGSAT
jgi:hypothetical protein